MDKNEIIKDIEANNKIISSPLEKTSLIINSVIYPIIILKY